MTYSDISSKDLRHLNAQIVKKINKLKNSTVMNEILAAQKLLSDNILIITDSENQRAIEAQH